MNLDLALILLMLAAAIAMFVVNRPRMDAVTLLVMVSMPFTGIITMNEALAGFADPSIILIAALFVIGEGLVRTGVARRLGDWLDAKAGGSENRLLILLMAAVGGRGSLMSSTAVVAIFIPVVLRISQNRGMAPSRLMMPLSFAALISGMLTLVATAPNLVVNAELIRQGAQGFNFFSFTPFGLPLLALGIVYMLFARGLLSSKNPPAAADRRPTLAQWIEQYGLADREKRGRISAGSALVGKRLDELSFRAVGVNLLAIERGTGFAAKVLRPTAQTELQAGDVLLADVHVSNDGANELWQSLKLEPAAAQRDRKLLCRPLPGDRRGRGHPAGRICADRPDRARGPASLRIRPHRHRVAARQQSGHARSAGGKAEDRRYPPADRLLVRHQSHTDDVVILNMPVELEEVLPASRRAPHALAVLALVVVLMVSGLIPNVQAALIGCLLMGLLGCVDFNSAYRSINWKTLILIVGMLPFSLALQRTGGVDLAADAVVGLVGAAAPRFVLATLFVITAALGLFISNTATAVLMAPVALAIAKDLGASPYPFAMIVALAASAAFMTPISSPVNTLVVGPGQYRFGDFVKVGVPFTVIVAIVSVLLVPIFLPF